MIIIKFVKEEKLKKMMQFASMPFSVYSPLPYLYSRIFHFSWKFYGEYWNQNVEKVMIHINDYCNQLCDYFGMIWIQRNNNRVVGIFLEGVQEEELCKKAADIIKINCCYFSPSTTSTSTVEKSGKLLGDCSKPGNNDHEARTRKINEDE